MATESDITFKHNIHITEKDMYLGQLSKVDGSFSESTAYLVSDFINIPNNTLTLNFVSKGGIDSICFYDAEKVFINYIVPQYWGGNLDWGEAKYFRACFKKNNNGAYGDLDFIRNPIDEFDNVYKEIEDTKQNIANEINLTNENVKTVNTDLQEFKDIFIAVEQYNTTVIKSGGVTGTFNEDGSVNVIEGDNRIISKIYDVSDVGLIRIHCSDSSVVRWSYLCLYTEDMTLIDNYSRAHKSDDDIIVVPTTDAKYMRWGYQSHNGDFYLYRKGVENYIGKSKIVKNDILEEFSLYPQKIYPTLLKTSLSLSTSGKVTVPERDEQFITTALDCSSYIDLLGVEKMDAYLALASSNAAFAFLDESKDTIKVYKKTDGELIPDNAECYKFENVEIPWNARYVAFNANRTGEYKYIVLYKRSVDKPKILGGRSPIFFKYEVDGGFDDFEDTEKSTQEQNPQELGSDEAVIVLPNKYTSDGTPTKLILYCHGASDTAISPSNTPPMIDGFAVVQFTGSPSNLRNDNYCETGVSMGNWQFIRCAASVYRYVCENFNIDSSNIYVLGTSLGGLCALNIAMSGCLPVRAIGLDAPVIDLYHDAYFNGNWFDSLNGVSTL